MARFEVGQIVQFHRELKRQTRSFAAYHNATARVTEIDYHTGEIYLEWLTNYNGQSDGFYDWRDFTKMEPTMIIQEYP